MITHIFNSKAARWIGVGWSVFLIENVVLSNYRSQIISKIGEKKYLQFFSTLSTVATGTILYGYFKYGRKSGPTISKPNKTILLAATCLQFLGFIGLSQSIPKLQIPFMKNKDNSDIGSKKFILRCPFDFKAKGKTPDEIYGVERISRHASLWFFSFSCIGQALSTIYISEIILYGFPIIFAIIGTTHQDYRYRRGQGGLLTKEKEEITSNFPFLAISKGKQSISDIYNEMRWLNASIGFIFASLLAIKRFKKF